MIIQGRTGRAAAEARAKAAPQVQPRSRTVLSMYGEPPAGEIRMEDFESYAIDRLCVLKEIEAQKAKGVQPDAMSE